MFCTKQLNAWDKKRMDEPDYGIRLTAYQTITQRVRDSKDICVDFLLPIIHNCCFFIINVSISQDCLRLQLEK